MTVLGPCSIINPDSEFYGRSGIYLGPSTMWPGMVRVAFIGNHPSRDFTCLLERREVLIENEAAS